MTAPAQDGSSTIATVWFHLCTVEGREDGSSVFFYAGGLVRINQNNQNNKLKDASQSRQVMFFFF